jgi:hypothetical protein
VHSSRQGQMRQAPAAGAVDGVDVARADVAVVAVDPGFGVPGVEEAESLLFRWRTRR